MSGLPNSWATASFTDIFDVQGGGQPPKSTFIYEPREGFVQLLQIRDFGARPVPTYIHDAENLKKCRVSDILIARYGASLGRILTGLEGAYNVAMAKVSIPEEIDRRFAFHLLNSEMFQAPLRLVSRSAQNGFNKEDLAGFQIAIAPLPEQKRIADKLDAVLARVDACRDRLDRIPTILKRFRQSVLAAAISGKLTEDWRVKNLRSLNDWSESTVGELIVRIEAGLNVKCEERPPEAGEIGLVKISAVTWGIFNDDESKTLPRGTSLPESARIQVGDFLISRANTLELVGACVLVDTVKRPVYLSDKVLRLVLPKETRPWLLYVLRSNTGRQQIETLASGNQLSMRNLSQANLKSIRIPMPLADEMCEIVRRVEALFACADRLEARYTAARAQVEKLTPATLAKAFRGELVPQDPNDEPASELLQRIHAQRVDQPKARRSSMSPSSA